MLAERAGDDVAARMVAGLGRAHQATRDLLVDPGMVPSELADAALLDQVRPTIADVCDDRTLADDQRGQQRRHHRARLTLADVRPAALPDDQVGRLDRFAQTAARIASGRPP